VPLESSEVELNRLRVEQRKAREDEVFGGLTLSERIAFNARAKRINELEIDLATIAFAKKSVQSANANQRDQWNKEAETDTPQGEAHQPYRTRENESANPFQDSITKRGTAKCEPEKKAVSKANGAIRGGLLIFQTGRLNLGATP
jgi:hypothetical protein